MMYKIPAFMMVMILVAWGCNEEANIEPDVAIETVSQEKQTCDFCQQEIRSARYGGQVTDKDGNTSYFRSIECLAGFASNQELESTENIRVINFIDGKNLLRVEDAIYLQSPNLGSPNGMDLAALDRNNKDMLEKIERAYPGEYIEWDEVLKRVVNSGYASNHQ